VRKYFPLLILVFASFAYASTRNMPVDVIQHWKQSATPSAPASGTFFSYFTSTDDQPHFQNSTGNAFGYVYSASSSPLVQHGMLLGAGANKVGSLDVCSSNTVFVGNTGADPSCRVLVNADLSSSAAIALSKLAPGNAYRVMVQDASGVLSENAALLASRALASDANGLVTHSAVTATELGYLSGATSNVQTQLGQKNPLLGYTPLNPANNLLDVSSTASARTNLGIGTAATLNALGLTTGRGLYWDGTQVTGNAGFINFINGKIGLGGATANPYPVKITGAIDTSKGYGLQITAPQANSGYLLDFQTNGGIRNFQFGSCLTSDTGLCLTQSSGTNSLQAWQGGLLAFGPDSGNQVPQYSYDFTQSSTSTSPSTDIIKASANALPIIMMRNTSNTANAYAGFGFGGTSKNAVAYIVAQIGTQTSSSETADLVFGTKSGGTMSESFRLAGSGRTLTLPGYGAGVCHFSSAGLISSSTVNLATEVTGTLASASNLPNSGVAAGSYTNANITVNAQGQVTVAANGSGGTTPLVAKFDLHGAVVPFTHIGGHPQIAAQSLTTVNIGLLNSGIAGTTVVKILQYRGGSLLNYATASADAATGNPIAYIGAALSGFSTGSALSLSSGDFVSVDVVSPAQGMPSDLTVTY
jgi:hypothetical protein